MLAVTASHLPLCWFLYLPNKCDLCCPVHGTGQKLLLHPSECQAFSISSSCTEEKRIYISFYSILNADTNISQALINWKKKHKKHLLGLEDQKSKFKVLQDRFIKFFLWQSAKTWECLTPPCPALLSLSPSFLLPLLFSFFVFFFVFSFFLPPSLLPSLSLLFHLKAH